MFLVFVNQQRAGSVSVAASGVTIGACFYIFKLKTMCENISKLIFKKVFLQRYVLLTLCGPKNWQAYPLFTYL